MSPFLSQFEWRDATIETRFDLLLSHAQTAGRFENDRACYLVNVNSINVILHRRTVLPQFFRHNSQTSFLRSMNFYGFRTVQQVKGRWRVFANPKFTRDSMHTYGFESAANIAGSAAASTLPLAAVGPANVTVDVAGASLQPGP